MMDPGPQHQARSATLAYLVMFGESVVVKDGKDQGLVERFTVRNLKVKSWDKFSIFTYIFT